MITAFQLRIAALVAAASLWAAPATAQLSDEQHKEAYCVFDKVAEGDAHYDIAEVFLYDDAAADIVKRADDAMRTAADSCAGLHSWDAAERELAISIGRYGSVTDYLGEELWIEGLDDDEIDYVFNALDRLSRQEIERLLDDSWLDDGAFTKRLDAVLIESKFPADDAYLLETGRLMMEATVLATFAVAKWADTHPR
jgi:hypothetical protein